MLQKKEKIKQARPEYHLAVPDLSDYNEIIIGYLTGGDPIQWLSPAF